jgi:hypothetical protein
MDEQHERRLRHKAIRLTLRGVQPGAARDSARPRPAGMR